MGVHEIERFLNGGIEPIDVPAMKELRSILETYDRMQEDGSLEALPEGVRELMESQHRALDQYRERIVHGISPDDLQAYHTRMQEEHRRDVAFESIYSATMQDGSGVGVAGLHTSRRG